MNIMRHHRVRPAESEPFVHRQVIGRPRKQARDLRDLLNIFVYMRLKQQPVVLAQQRLANLQHGLRRRERKARSDGVQSSGRVRWKRSISKLLSR